MSRHSADASLPPPIGLASLTQPRAPAAPGSLAHDTPAPRPQAAAARLADDAAGSRTLGVEFTGSGAEYFRIWIVNLLLTLVTAGLYYPWAKVRKLRYFYGNTLVGGHALDFHGDPKRMLRGYLLVGLFFVLYSVAGNVSPVAGAIALLLLAGLWPALFRASMRFRLANTSWRGLRFRFTGDTAGAYKAMLPLFVPALLVVVLPAFTSETAGPPSRADAAFAGILAMVVMVTTFAALPAMWWLLKRYQHDNYQLAALRTQFRASVKSFYGVFLKAGLLMLLVLVVVGSLAALLGAAGALFGSGRRGGAAMVVAIMLAFVVGYATVLLLVHPYVTAKMQNLVWSRTGSRGFRFDSALRFAPLLVLTLKNWLLILLTLGLYWPFAAVATARMRLEAVEVQTRIDVDTLVARSREQMNDAAGDAAGDVAGIDVGL